ncbi:unnamed protein product [Phytomonas sp. Hart1]|nr:unnamed protein product [Phytomonas sp. Hart1]|eukprot:CCW69933.1 unnamed protein product [Phytomonas sp. isolate Hart1]
MTATPCASFVRVRPFDDREAAICPEGCSAPREILLWDGKDVLTVLDPQDDFAPRRNGTFAGMNVLWSFKDAESPFRPCGQAEVYQRVVTPGIARVVAGYNAAFLLAGAANSGRFYTLYGDDLEGPDRGILPRFADDIFHAFARQSHENRTLSARMECVEMAGETYVDLLALRRSRTPRQAATAGEELKVVQGVDGARLSGATEVEIKGPEDLHSYLRQIQRAAIGRTNTHTVSLRFTETFQFDDPENFGHPVNKSRHVHVVFALLRNMPMAFQRSLDVAVEHDSGENPLAKVPVRETAFTRLFPLIFQQGYNLSVISCVTPYYEHVRENLNALLFAVKVKSLVGKPKLHQDERLLEMRLLADEVKDLKVTVRKQNEATQIVQKELNSREVELMRQEALYNDSNYALKKQQEKLKLAAIAHNFEATRSKHALEKIKQHYKKKIKELETSKEVKSLSIYSTDSLMQAIDDSKIRNESLELKIRKQNEILKEYESRFDKYNEEKEELAYLKKFNNAPPSEHKKLFAEHSAAHKAAEKEIRKLKEEEAAVRATDNSDERMKGFQKEYDLVYAAEKPSRDKRSLLKQIEKLENETTQADKEIMQLQTEIDESKSQCNCTVM